MLKLCFYKIFDSLENTLQNMQPLTHNHSLFASYTRLQSNNIMMLSWYLFMLYFIGQRNPKWVEIFWEEGREGSLGVTSFSASSPKYLGPSTIYFPRSFSNLLLFSLFGLLALLVKGISVLDLFVIM